MDVILFRNWWLVALRGLLALMFGIFALLFPRATVLALVLYFGALTLFGGAMLVVLAIRRARHHESWGWWMLEGVVDIVFGLFVVLYPGISVSVFVLFLAAWALVIGVIQVISALRLRRRFRYWWLTLLYGLLAIVFGILIFFNPFGGAVAVVVAIGVFALVYGALLLFTALGLRAMHGTPGRG